MGVRAAGVVQIPSTCGSPAARHSIRSCRLAPSLNPETRNASSYILAFDNTGSLATGLAIANVAPFSSCDIILQRPNWSRDVLSPPGGSTLSLGIVPWAADTSALRLRGLVMNTEDFDKLLVEYTGTKEKYVDRRLKFYVDRVDNKRKLAQWSRLAVLLLSLAIPPVVTFSPDAIGLVQKSLIISLMSLLIALAGGLEGLHQWQRTWREYSARIVQIETLIGLWEIAVTRARRLSDAQEVSDILGNATQTLLSSVNEAVTTEMGTFFSEREKAQVQPNTQT